MCSARKSNGVVGVAEFARVGVSAEGIVEADEGEVTWARLGVAGVDDRSESGEQDDLIVS